jgi:ubiquinone/menaquinone biosynthesis C-methylase UbiE
VTAPRINTDSLKAVYGEGAGTYDALWHPVIRPPALALIDSLDLRSATRVLDVGAGTGALAAPLRTAAPRALIVSIDSSAAMLRVAHERHHAIPCLGDASLLPIRDGCADAVLLAYVLFHLVDPVVGIRETARALRTGGVAGTVTWASETPPSAAKVWEDTLSEYDVPTLPDHGNHTDLDTEKKVRGLLSANGLDPTSSWRASLEYGFSAETYVQLRSGGGSGRARLARVAAETAAAAITEAERRMLDLEPSAFAFRGEVICSVSVKPSEQ